ncbi:MAG: hypothetical protein M3440_03180 [Chloroflexota bacterium]|nr:hypothetical protein [Chloroflexota bacterium]
MPWNQFWKRSDLKREEERREETPLRASTPGAAESRGMPPHLASAFAERKRRPESGGSPDEERKRRLDALKKRRNTILYDVRQGEQAQAENNPWQNRIALLTEALTTVSDDLKRLAAAPKSPYHPLPPTPINIDQVEGGDAVVVVLRVGDERFEYAEELDWAERGHQIARTDLVRRSGDPARLLPDDTPAELRSALKRHLTNSLFVLATDLRERLLDGEPLPEQITLADLAGPCPECGGWTDWRGTCQACAQRAAAAAELKREEVRLLDERAAEAEERHRLVDRLGIARRRLHDVEIEIAALSDDS